VDFYFRIVCMVVGFYFCNGALLPVQLPVCWLVVFRLRFMNCLYGWRILVGELSIWLADSCW
jgi:hypothetical protein